MEAEMVDEGDAVGVAVLVSLVDVEAVPLLDAVGVGEVLAEGKAVAALLGVCVEDAPSEDRDAADDKLATGVSKGAEETETRLLDKDTPDNDAAALFVARGDTVASAYVGDGDGLAEGVRGGVSEEVGERLKAGEGVGDSVGVLVVDSAGVGDSIGEGLVQLGNERTKALGGTRMTIFAEVDTLPTWKDQTVALRAVSRMETTVLPARSGQQSARGHSTTLPISSNPEAEKLPHGAALDERKKLLETPSTRLRHPEKASLLPYTWEEAHSGEVARRFSPLPSALEKAPSSASSIWSHAYPGGLSLLTDTT